MLLKLVIIQTIFVVAACLTILFIFFHRDDCEKSELLSVTSCSYSHDGTYCLNRYKNGRMSVGSAGVVGEKYCTKGLEVYQE